MAFNVLKLVDLVVQRDVDLAGVEAMLGSRAAEARHGTVALAPTDAQIARAWIELDEASAFAGVMVLFREPIAVRFDLLTARFGEPTELGVPLHATPRVYPRLFAFERPGAGGTLTVSPVDRVVTDVTRLASVAVRRFERTAPGGRSG